MVQIASLVPCWWLLGSLVAAVASQGPLYRERWADLHLELLREKVQNEFQGHDRPTRQKVAELLAAPASVVPVRAAALALAELRGVECDDAFLFRACTSCFLLPEIADPVGSKQICRDLHVSLFMPINLPIPGQVAFELEAFDESGAPRRRGRVEQDLAIEDLRMARPTVSIPTAELADGSYQLRLVAYFDGQGPRPADPGLQHRFHVLRGYQARVEAAQARCAELREEMPARDYALLHGLLLECNRAYSGEAFDGSSDALADLERLEQAIGNIEARRSPLHGMRGLVPVTLPFDGEPMLQVVLRLPAERPAARPRGLVVVIGGAPAHDVRGHRPSAPPYRTSRWVARRVGDLGLGDDYQLAWMQSPGPGISFVKALPAALAALRELLHCDGKTVLVLELEAAVALSYGGSLLGDESIGAALVGAGAFSSRSLSALGDLRMLGIPLTGHPSGRSLQQLDDIAAGRHGSVDWSGSFELAPPAPRPWTFGAAAAGDEIAAFVRACLAQK